MKVISTCYLDNFSYNNLLWTKKSHFRLKVSLFVIFVKEDFNAVEVEKLIVYLILTHL